jgi:hypothetical protein
MLIEIIQPTIVVRVASSIVLGYLTHAFLKPVVFRIML